jgi:hypothetical protein
VAGGERADILVTGEGEKGRTGGARLPERGRARLTSGADRSAGGEARCERGWAHGRWAVWAERGTGARARERGGWAESGPAEGEDFLFPFLFLFLFLFLFFFNLLFLLNKYLSMFLGCRKIFYVRCY